LVEVLQAKIMSKNRVYDPFEDLKKIGHPKKAAKREIPRIISKLYNRKRFDRKNVSFQLAALLLVAILLILLPVFILTQTVSASGTPTAAFSALPISGCSPLTITFTETSNGNGYTITKWEWDFNGDGVIDRTDTTKPTAFTYTYSTPGIYTVTLKVTTSYGTNTKTRTNYITAQGSKADFTATPTSGCSPLTVTFTNAAQGIGKTITKWQWDFTGDGTIERTDTTAPSPFPFTYSTPGTYTAKLTTTTSCGTNTMSKTSYITTYGPPTANFTATPYSGCSPLTVTFTNTSNGNGRTIISWTWDFGDATTYNGQTPPAHIYPNRGTYTVKLTVTSACGSNTKTAYVTVSSQPVVVPGTYGPVCVSGGNITLGGSPGGGTWFGDGISGNSFNPVVAGPGNHVLTYQYTSGSSCSSSNATTLTVVPLPQTTITVE
jgi:PKD repeat protein